MTMGPPFRHDAPGTSRDAAHSMAGRSPTVRDEVWGYLRERREYGATDQESQVDLQLTSDTQVPRRWELVKLGVVVDSGRKRRTRSNCSAVVWVASEFARAQSGGGA